MTPQMRLSRALERLSAGAGVIHIREGDSRRAERNGDGRDERLEEAVDKFEAAADELWKALGVR
jgi:hypothetical protein